MMSTACPYPAAVARATTAESAVSHVATHAEDGYHVAVCDSLTGDLADDPLDATCEDCWADAALPQEVVDAALLAGGFDPYVVGEHGRRYLERMRAERKARQ